MTGTVRVEAVPVVGPGERPDPGSVEAVLSVLRAAAATDDPGGPPPSVALALAGHLVERPPERYLTWLATDPTGPVGVLTATVHADGHNDGLAEVDTVVVPARRRRGVATALAAAAARGLRAAGCVSVVAWPSTEAGVRWCRRLGLTFRLLERVSRVRVAEVDPTLMDRWISEAPARSLGYEVVTFSAPCPDELLEALAVADTAIGDAPVDDLDWTEPPATPERLRASEAWAETVGMDLLWALALAPDGTGAGASVLMVPRDDPRLVHQGDTAVVARHRGHRLGRWLKAANFARLRALHPGAEVIETENAESNPPMLAINEEMGFRTHRHHHVHQGPLEAVEAALG